MARKRPCYEFATRGTCKYQNRCRFIHDATIPDAPSNMNDRPKPRKNAKLSASEQAFMEWRNNIPLQMNDGRSYLLNKPLGGKLASFFQEARRLIDLDPGVLQDVIQCLAKEPGLRCIRELLGQDFKNMTASKKADVFKTQLLPFLETVSHHNVVASLVLEQQVGTIYNVLYGIRGSRAAEFLSFIADVLAAGDKDQVGARHLEISLLVFSTIVDLNSTAAVQPRIHAQAEKFRALFASMDTRDMAGLLHDARAYLDRLLRRLDMGSSLPTAPTEQKAHTPSDMTFVSPRSGPGGRHDNDHEDICSISIMPTSGEIVSTRTEYLPAADPAQWHIGGIKGLLDRNFRLLREDTVGQLRDAIYEELVGSDQSSPGKAQLRTLVYRDATVAHVGLECRAGLYLGVRFPQPMQARQIQKPQDREEWWKMSKRLQSGALVCLVSQTRSVLFCTVAQGTLQTKSKEANEANQHWLHPGTLWKDRNTASVMLEPVEPTQSLGFVVDQYDIGEAAMSLVEFPGVLLPAFEPTLQALQSINKTDSLPLSHLLLPPNPDSTTRMEVAPPTYTTKPGFAFNLRCLMANDADLYLRRNEPFNIEEFQSNSTLDRAQAAALVDCLQRQIGLTQGPPGTGKSFTGVALIKVLLANKRRLRLENDPAVPPNAGADIGPIICVTYTNHALDQLLLDLLDNKATSQIVRIGSRSKSTRLEDFNLLSVSKDTERTKVEKESQWRSHRDLEVCEKEFTILKIGKEISHLHICRHLLSSLRKTKEGFQIAGNNKPQKLINRWLHSGRKAKVEPRPLVELEHVNLFEMSSKERQAIHEHWTREIRERQLFEGNHLVRTHLETKTIFNNVHDEVNIRCLAEADVIGVTTFGLARKLDMLRRLRCKVVICEEAGEVLESHLLTALLPSIQHAIFIGDHLQLAPQIQNYELSRENPRSGKEYMLDVSLFERLVDSGSSAMSCGLPFSTLETQRRMHPSIAQLIRDTLYPHLENAASVSEYPEVSGMRKRLFWMDHRQPEADGSITDALSTSHSNSFEVEMTVALVSHLVRQGQYQSGDIAVLTPYLGQLHRLRQRLSQSFAILLGEGDQDQLDNAGYEDESHHKLVKSSLLHCLRVATVDNFQGDEAKVVVISLVRSNAQNRCGFLRTSNPINVLLSRAKHGMYIIGNSQTSINVPMWAKVVDILEQGNNIGKALELQCPRHMDAPLAVTRPEDFPRVSPEGGCDLPCSKRLACGHVCIQKCHSDLLHDHVFCLEPCPRPPKDCTHLCPNKCGDPCPTQCLVDVFQEDRVLDCGHVMQILPCWQHQDISTVKCPVIVDKVVPHCKHTVRAACHVDVESIWNQCTAQCRTPLPCGHYL